MTSNCHSERQRRISSAKEDAGILSNTSNKRNSSLRQACFAPQNNSCRKSMNSSQTPKIILASGSRRRNELLALCGIEFTTIPSDVDEDEVSKGQSDPKRLAKLLAQAKAE